MAKTLDEIKTDFQTRLDRLTADVAAQTTIEASVKALLVDQGQQLATVRQQLADALAAGPADASVLQPILDSLDTQIAGIEASTADLSAAVTANTPAQAAPAAQGGGAGV